MLNIDMVPVHIDPPGIAPACVVALSLIGESAQPSSCASPSRPGRRRRDPVFSTVGPSCPAVRRPGRPRRRVGVCGYGRDQGPPLMRPTGFPAMLEGSAGTGRRVKNAGMEGDF